MDLLFFGVFFVAFLFFIWAGRHFDNSIFLIVGGILAILLAFFVFGSNLTYTMQTNQTIDYSGDYYKYLNASSTGYCSDGLCYGIADCSGLDSEIECQACDQCAWGGAACVEIAAGASCNNSVSCLNCPGCSVYPAYHDTSYNLTVGGEVLTKIEYEEKSLTETERIALGLFFSLIGFYILIVELSGIIGSRGDKRQYGI